jgi:hypothetical protein
MVERVPRRSRQVFAPEPLHQRVDVDDATAVQREHREQGLTLRAADVCDSSAREHLERAQKPDLQQLWHRRYYLLERVSHARARA